MGIVCLYTHELGTLDGDQWAIDKLDFGGSRLCR
jgi:hypothetical protein